MFRCMALLMLCQENFVVGLYVIALITAIFMLSTL